MSLLVTHRPTAISALAAGESLSEVFGRLRTRPERSVAFTDRRHRARGEDGPRPMAGSPATRSAAFREGPSTFPPDEEASAARVFDLARQGGRRGASTAYARRIRAMFGRRRPRCSPTSWKGCSNVAAADGQYHPREDEFLQEVAGIFGIDDRQFRSIRARFIPRIRAGPL